MTNSKLTNSVKFCHGSGGLVLKRLFLLPILMWVQFSAFGGDWNFKQAIDSVPEYSALRSKLEAMKVRGWLFGGTAFTFACAVRDWESDEMPVRKLNLLLNQGKIRSVWDIYAPTQDLDVVIDGTEENAKELESWLNRHYPYKLPDFLGAKSAWEVRLLRNARDKKIALFENPEFLNIHSDTGSTGMLKSPSLLRLLFV
jgi:hypothetical protein